MGLLGIRAGIAQRLALAHEVPQLIELDANLLQAVGVLLEVRVSSALAPPKLFALGFQPLDHRSDLFV